MHSFPGRDKPDLFIVNTQERNSGLKKAVHYSFMLKKIQ